MAGLGHCSIRIFLTSTLIVSLIASLLCEVARGDDLRLGKPFRIRAAAFAPIGKVYSLGEISINGRTTYGEQPIWSGDLLEVPEGGTAQVTIDSVGSIALTHTTAARMAVLRPTLDVRTENFVLMISLISGAASVTLREGGSAFLQAGGSAFSTTRGSTFRALIRGGRAIIDVLSGRVEIEPGPPKRHCSITVDEYDPLSGRQTPIQIGETIKKKKGQKAALLAKLKVEDTNNPKQKNLMGSLVRAATAGWGLSETIQQSGGQSGVSRRLKFELGTQGVGELVSATDRGQSVTVITDPQGSARVTFEAGSRQGSTKLTVTDVTENRVPDETRDDWYAEFRVEKGFWERHRSKVILGGIAAAVIVIITRPTKPLQQEPPPVIP